MIETSDVCDHKKITKNTTNFKRPQKEHNKIQPILKDHKKNIIKYNQF